jgi:hypothetical protein
LRPPGPPSSKTNHRDQTRSCLGPKIRTELTTHARLAQQLRQNRRTFTQQRRTPLGASRGTAGKSNRRIRTLRNRHCRGKLSRARRGLATRQGLRAWRQEKTLRHPGTPASSCSSSQLLAQTRRDSTKQEKLTHTRRPERSSDPTAAPEPSRATTRTEIDTGRRNLPRDPNHEQGGEKSASSVPERGSPNPTSGKELQLHRPVKSRAEENPSATKPKAARRQRRRRPVSTGGKTQSAENTSNTGCTPAAAKTRPGREPSGIERENENRKKRDRLDKLSWRQDLRPKRKTKSAVTAETKTGHLHTRIAQPRNKSPRSKTRVRQNGDGTHERKSDICSIENEQDSHTITAVTVLPPI